MRVYVYPADAQGCGHYRLIWPARELIKRGHDVQLVMPGEERNISARLEDGVPREVFIPTDADVIVLQRPTHIALARSVPLIRERGVAVVVDMDDDLSRIHPHNPAWRAMHPDPSLKSERKMRDHSWLAAEDACRDATLVTLSTPALTRRYARHGRSVVLPNRVPASFLEIEHQDSDRVGWPASVGSHPDDPSVCGWGVSRALDELGQRLTVVSDPIATRRAFGLNADPENIGFTDLTGWATHVTQLGIALSPLADTQFNEAKSWLKPLECAAVGVPIVMSPRAEYVRIHRAGVGYLARSPRDWYRHVVRLARDPVERQEASARAREVVSTWTYEECAGDWADAWTQAYDLASTGRSVFRRAPA